MTNPTQGTFLVAPLTVELNRSQKQSQNGWKQAGMCTRADDVLLKMFCRQETPQREGIHLVETPSLSGERKHRAIHGVHKCCYHPEGQLCWG